MVLLPLWEGDVGEKAGEGMNPNQCNLVRF